MALAGARMNNIFNPKDDAAALDPTWRKGENVTPGAV